MKGWGGHLCRGGHGPHTCPSQARVYAPASITRCKVVLQNERGIKQPTAEWTILDIRSTAVDLSYSCMRRAASEFQNENEAPNK